MVTTDGGANQTIDVGMLERMLTASPRDGNVWTSLGVLLRREGKLTAAIACHHRGAGFAPDSGVIWSNMGNALTDAGRWDDALRAHARACALQPDVVSSTFNHAIGLRKSSRFAAASVVLDRARRLDPNNPSIRWEQALNWLQIGDYARGLPEYEMRRHIPAYRNRIAPGPAWDGGPLNGRTLFLSTEQGFGDTLMAARYLPLVRAQGGRILMECHTELQRLLSCLAPDAFVAAGAPLPAYDVQASLMSLPLLFATTPDAVPPPTPVHIPEASREKAARLIGPLDGTLKVGIVWSGRVTFADNARRATTLNRFLRFAEIPGVQLFSLQKGPPEAQIAEFGAGSLLTALGPHFDDFADTAAAIERLDLIVMTDSSVAHLAGSLGKPVWNLVQYAPYWIYGHEGEGTPWYPAMRLFRQGADEDWEPVFQRVKQELTELAAAKAQQSGTRR